MSDTYMSDTYRKGEPTRDPPAGIPPKLPPIVIAEATIDLAIAEVLAIVGPRVHEAADRLARGDPYLTSELEQLALFELWNLDPMRYPDEHLRYLLKRLVSRMQNGARAERLAEGGARR